jgi:hypothetical protein
MAPTNTDHVAPQILAAPSGAQNRVARANPGGATRRRISARRRGPPVLQQLQATSPSHRRRFSLQLFFIDSYPISTTVPFQSFHRLIIYANMRFFTFVSLAVLALTSTPALAVPTGIQYVIPRCLAPSAQR